MTIDLEAIADRIAIEECVYRYAHLVDAMQFHRIAEDVFTLDGSIDFGGTRSIGREAIHAQCMAYQGALLGCSHNVTNLVIELAGDEARAASRILAWHWFAIPDADPLRPTDLLAIGGYEDRLRRTAEGWRIYERRGINFGTGVGAGQVPEPMRAIFTGMQGRVPSWPA
ncbi:nuclear transport factor 2 family protein [Novosphingobium sp. BL-52-GroH]|uniref:nuclear transport factor 2 family protein n=1 Tax=Novosphingobium sp. BL-52-GroH TaxID=3349877 RepID=UPI00384DC5F7